jgi:hypothetical protein
MTDTAPPEETPSDSPVADDVAAVVNSLKDLVATVQQEFDALRVTVQAKIDEIQAKLASIRQ